MSLDARLTRIKQTHGIQLEQSEGFLDIRSSNDVVPYQHGSFISRTTRSTSRANSRHHEIMSKLKWLTEAPLPQIGPLSHTNDPSLLSVPDGNPDAREQPARSPRSIRSSRELRSSSSGAGSKRSHPSSSRESSPSRKRAAVAVAEKKDRVSPPLLRSSRRGSADAGEGGKSAVDDSGEAREARGRSDHRSHSENSASATSNSTSSSKHREPDCTRRRYPQSFGGSPRSSPRSSPRTSSPGRRSGERPRNSHPRSSRGSASRESARQSGSAQRGSSLRSSSRRSSTSAEDSYSGSRQSTSSRNTSASSTSTPRSQAPVTSPSASPSSVPQRSPVPTEILSSSENPSEAFLKLAKKHESEFEAKKAEGTLTKREADACTTQEKRAMFYLTAGLKYLEAIAFLEEAVIAYRTVPAEKFTKVARSKKNELSQKILVLYSTTAKFFGDCAGLILQPLKSRHSKALATALNNTASLCYLCQSVSLMRRVYSLRHRLASTRLDWLKSLKSSGKDPAKKEQINFLTDTGDALMGMEAWEQARKLRTIGKLPSVMLFVSAPSIADMIKHVQLDEGYTT